MVCLLAARPSLARTPPADGAVEKPDDFVIHWPFEAGEAIRVSSGYGPSGGSSLHAGTNRASSANDHHALDLVLSDRPDNGRGEPVLAIASGTVVRAGWATAGWASYGQRVIVQHDWSGDGHAYVSIYCHLNEVVVQEGEAVSAGATLGTVGGSSGGDLDGLGVHLHFALHRDSEIGGSGTGGSYGGHAVVPEPMDGAEDLAQGTIAVSANDGSDPRVPCAVVGPGETILDDRGPCFRRAGPADYWHEELTGWDDGSLWTFTTDDPEPTNWGVWRLELAEAGTYELAAWIPGAFGQSERATYEIRHAGTDSAALARQPDAPDGWLVLGSFDFAEGGDQWVRLDDDTGEPYVDASSTRIAFDALRVRAAGLPDPDAGAPDEADAGPDASPRAVYSGADGCSCRALPSRPASSPALLALVAVLLARRRPGGHQTTGGRPARVRMTLGARLATQWQAPA